MSEFLGDKPSSRVLRPPGGGSSNIFGGSDDQSSKRSNVKPTYQSSVFNSEPEPSKPRPSPGTRPRDKNSDIFGSGPTDNGKNASPDPKKISKTHQSSLFQEPEPMSAERKKDSANRYDPITGSGAERGDKTAPPPPAPAPVLNAPFGKENGQPKPAEPEPAKDHNPHLGPIKNDSGVRCAQPPGGKSSISFY